jgi:hypothetical protein
MQRGFEQQKTEQLKRWKHTRKTQENKTKNDQRRQQDHLHKLRMTVGMPLITMPRSPFEQRGPVPRLLRIPRQTTSATHSEVMNIGPESAERHTEDLLYKKTSRDCLWGRQCRKCRFILWIWVRYIDVNVKGRLKKYVELREQIGTSKFILDVIKEGYKIPLLHKPEKTFLRNN